MLLHVADWQAEATFDLQWKEPDLPYCSTRMTYPTKYQRADILPIVPTKRKTDKMILLLNAVVAVFGLRGMLADV